MKINKESAKANEMAVLAGAMLDMAGLYAALYRLTESDFIWPENKAVFRGMQQLEQQGKPVDFLTLSDEAGCEIEYLMKLQDYLPSSAAAEHYIALVAANGREHRINRELVQVCKGEEEALPQLESLVDRERGLMKPLNGENPLADDVDAFLEDLMNPNEMERIKTGLPTIDNFTGGLPKGSISIIGARPGTGKTALMLNWSLYPLHSKQTGVVFSLEMSKRQLLERYAAMLAKVNYSLINRRQVKDNAGIAMISEQMVELSSMKRLHLLDDVNTITGIVSEIARIKPDIVYIDYMQIIEAARSYRDRRDREIADICREIKKAAKKYNCHICVFSQLVRGKSDDEPDKSSLKESGSQEEQFDIVMLLHRPDFYDPVKDIGGDHARLKIDKNKYGQTAKLELHFDGLHQIFTEMARRGG